MHIANGGTWETRVGTIYHLVLGQMLSKPCRTNLKSKVCMNHRYYCVHHKQRKTNWKEPHRTHQRWGKCWEGVVPQESAMGENVF